MATPATPSRLVVNVVSSTALDVFWSSSGANTAFYCIERGATGGPYTEIARVPVSQTAYHNLGLTAGTQYCYKVRGFDGVATYGNYVGETCATTKGVTTDHAVARFDGTTYALQNSLAILDDAGNLTTPGTIASKPAGAGIQLDPNAATGNFILSLSPANLTGIQRVTFGNVTGTAALGAGTLTNATANDVTVAAHTHAITGTFPASAHNVLDSAYHSDVLTGAITRGDLLYGNATPKIARLALGGAAGSFVTRDANDVLWSTMTLPNAATAGDILYASGANAIGNLADVAVGSALVSGGVGVAPAYSASPTLTGLTLSGLTASTVIYSDAANAITSLANAAGVLTNNGIGGLSWGAAGGVHDLLSATHSDTTASAVARGDLVVGVAGPSWDNLALGGAAGSLLTRDANDVLWSTYFMTGFANHTYAWPDYSMSFPGADAHGYLHSDGAGTLTWDAGGAGGAHDILSATHTDSAAAAVVDGDTIIGNVTPAWSKLAISIPAANVRNALGIDNGELRPSWKTALDGNDPTAITVNAAGAPGTSLIFSHRDHRHASPVTWTATDHNLLSATHGDTAANAATRGGLIYGDAIPSWNLLSLGGAAGSFVTRDADDILWSAFYLVGTAAQTYTFPATGGTVAMLNAANTFTLGNTMSAILTVNANIQFPAIQVPNAGANVLDDYEELTWVPDLQFGGAKVDITYGTQTGIYTKVGNMVFLSARIVLTSKGSPVGNATISGFPFAVGTNHIGIIISGAGMSGLTGPMFLSAGGYILYQAAAAWANITNAHFTNTSDIRISMVYSV